MTRVCEAKIEGEEIVIRLNINELEQLVRYAPWNGYGVASCSVVDVNEFANAVIFELNIERSDGQTFIETAFDEAMVSAIESGCKGIEEDLFDE